MQRSINLDPVVRKFVNKIKRNPPLRELGVFNARAFLEHLQTTNVPHMPAIIEDIDPQVYKGRSIVSIRLVKPIDSLEDIILPGIIYFHGGGWILGSAHTHDPLIRELANRVNAVVVFVNYTRSPEATWVTQLDEAQNVLDYIIDEGLTYGIDSNRIALVGDSAGGNLATTTAMLAASRRIYITAQVLLYPVTDIDFNTESFELYKDGPWLTEDTVKW